MHLLIPILVLNDHYQIIFVIFMIVKYNINLFYFVIILNCPFLSGSLNFEIFCNIMEIVF